MPRADKKIRILYQVLPYVIGGSERFLYNLIKHLNPKTYHPIIFSWSGGKAIDIFISLGVETKIIDVRYPKKLNNLTNFLKESKIDIAQSSHFYPALAMAAHIARIPHIWRLGDDIRNACPDLDYRQREYFLNMVSILSKRIVCPSRFLKQQIKDIKNPGIDIIYNGIDFDEMDSIIRHRNRFNVGMVAYFIPQKRHIDFIRSAKRVKRQIKNIKFFIIGTNYPTKESSKYLARLYRIVKNMNMDRDTIFTGFRKDIFKVMANMDLVILPSIDEGSSNAIIEAMGLGKPVIASDSGSNPEFVKDGITGFLVPPKDPTKLSNAIIKTLKNPRQAKSMGKAGIERVKKLFDIRKIVTQYENLYQKALFADKKISNGKAI